MKYKIAIAFFIVFGIQLANAAVEKDSISRFTFQKMLLFEEDDCDACSCSASGGGMGFGSMLYSNFVGVRYLNQSYSSRDGIFANSPWVDEDFNTIQVWSKIPVTKKIQIFALIPFQFHSRELSSGTENIEGLGDISIIAMYTVFQTDTDSTTLTHKLQFGGGVKLPTGKYDAINNLGTVNKSFQVGTGSWDYLFVTDYVVQHKNLGLNLLFDYTFKTENQKNYQYGNQINYGSLLFYLFDLDKVKLFPHFGIVGEVYDSNKHYGEELPDTSGDIVFGKLGLEVGKNKFSFGASAMLPINQNLTGGNVEANYRWSLNLNYSL